MKSDKPKAAPSTTRQATQSEHRLAGVLPVVQTPFLDNLSLDQDTLQREIEWLFEQGADGIVMGMVSETLRLTDDERDQLLKVMVKSAAGHGPVISSVGAESLRQAIRHAQAAENIGVDAHMALPPALTQCPPDEIRSYYAGLIKATTKPVIVQDASGYVGNMIPIETQARLFLDFPGRVMFKPEAQPIGPNLTLLRDATKGRAAIFEGTGGIALVDSYRRGITGTMPGSDLIWAIVALWNALQKEDHARVEAIQGPLVSIISLQTSLDAFLAIEKMLLVEQGIFRNTLVRGPVGYRLDAESRREILRLFNRLREVCR
jgi:dihydrodipicolinate synthase/N-acetylneuraminate lyase